jgi:thymidylate kinase
MINRTLESKNGHHSAAPAPEKIGAVSSPKLTALATLVDLFSTLNQAGIRYCHWKSNIRLADAVNGRTDLDLLVAPEQGSAFRQILAAHHVQPLIAAPGRDYPDIENYLGFDAASGRFFHLHVHYQLVLGEQFVKNYRLPLMPHFFNSICLPDGVLIPAPEMELIVLSLRALLKYRDRDALKDILTIRAPGLPNHIRQEIDWLWDQTTSPRLQAALREVEHLIPTRLVLNFLQTVSCSPRDGWQLLRLRQQVRRGLRPYQHHHRLQASLIYFREAWRQRKRFGNANSRRKMTLPGGGQTVAFIGVDGAGKSTMCQLVKEWLGWKLDVHFYYLGSKQPSRRSRWLYLLFRIARRSQRSVSRQLGEQNWLARWLATGRQTLLYSHHLSLAHDRRRRYRAGLAQAAAGSLVIFDRYPLAANLDGPKIQQLSNGDEGKVSRYLGAAEASIYRQMAPPDHYFLLNVSPEISRQRKPDHDPAVIQAKSQVLDRWLVAAERQASSAAVHGINANRPFDEVVQRLKTAVWQAITQAGETV